MVVLVADINTSAKPVSPQGNLPQWMRLIGCLLTHAMRTAPNCWVSQGPRDEDFRPKPHPNVSDAFTCPGEQLGELRGRHPGAFCKNRDSLFVLLQDAPKGDTEIEGEVGSVGSIQDCHARKQRRERLAVNGLYCKGKFPQQIHLPVCSNAPCVWVRGSIAVSGSEAKSPFAANADETCAKPGADRDATDVNGPIRTFV
ncbi:hypothetical protein GCM10010961_29440 [Pseudodonghicola xiamenensis]|uniref:Uncharacterized protein n=1 Tax=Pseudodonghicola xiamenensis TaxID=337702 RepID=A0A8J3HA69_9RHOB|nr:hypothetical protein GCM10010961_29440 [Pseudodonghicola xiamenensis]